MQRIAVIALLAFTPALHAGSVNLLVNPGFETPVTIPTSYPTTYGRWSHDVATIVGAERGITPRGGDYMIRFDYTSPFGPDLERLSVDVIQLVNVTSFSDAISSGHAMLHGSYFANRLSFDAQTDTAFGIIIAAYNAEPSSFPSIRDIPLAMADVRIEIDADVASWEPISAELLLPVNTRFVQFRAFSFENIFNDSSGVEFDGHYADDAQLTLAVVPLPPVAAACFGTLALMGAMRRRTFSDPGSPVSSNGALST